MLRKHVAPLAALMAFGAIALSACGTGDAAQPTAPQQRENSGSEESGGSSELSLLSGTARSNKADEKTGDLAPKNAAQDVKDKWVQLRATKAGELNPVVVNGAGMTLYRFDPDTANPSKATCDGDCAKTWPPVTIAKGGKVIVAGVRKSDVGVVKRDDGRLQVTVKGWPVYLFSKDAKPGDTLGHGVGGTWFGVTPDGRKAGAPQGTGKPQPTRPSDPAVKPATSVTLFTGKDFDDTSGDNFARGLAGKGCQNTDGDFLSLTVAGSLKLWSEPNCKGTAKVVTDDVADVTALGFPTGPKSVFFG
ncbi:COG4315 family predicted lipoprotein [Actinosynnema sp. CS-041913]|uniref:COG4315 family predicted lipoprotein n=1 Tax=Actinosynnema sp. CS-041913 TaxID=3239917 RepID=UPI003D8F6F22